MTISGWASYGKQPYAHGDPYTSYNRDALKLKMRLTPYLYTYCREAYETGVPTVRGMVLEFPDDSTTWGTDTAYQFMSGEWFLVAPVYQDTTQWSNIYLPEGEWIDYNTGERFDGPQTLDNYDAALEVLPVFVKAGAIIPMWPEMLHHREKPKNPLTLDIYPKKTSRFEFYEDDGVTRKFDEGEFAKQLITSDMDNSSLIVVIGESIGDFQGKLEEREYLFEIHITEAPQEVSIQGDPLDEASSLADLESADEGWFFDASDRNGVLHVKTASCSLSEPVELSVAL